MDYIFALAIITGGTNTLSLFLTLLITKRLCTLIWGTNWGGEL